MNEAKLNRLIRTQWDAIVNLMDAEKCAQVHDELAPCPEIEFWERYIELDPKFEDLIDENFG